MTNLNNIFDQFFGDVLKKADEVVERVVEKEMSKMDQKEKEYLDKVFDQFFGDVLKKADSIKR